MTTRPKLLPRAATPAKDLRQVRAFLADHGTDLASKAHVLGGRAASARVFLLTEAVAGALRLTRAQKRQLVALHGLLTLRDVGDPDRIETACFAEIDPASPFVAECCLLADRLGALLAAIAEDNQEPASAATPPALDEAA